MRHYSTNGFRGEIMESFSRGWEFLKQAWGMAFKDKDLLKPSIYARVVGAIVSVVGIIPIALAGLAFGGSSAGNVVMGVMGWIMVFIQFVVTYDLSGMTAYVIFGSLSEGDGRLDKASSDLSELAEHADRVLVLFRGAVVAELARHELDEERLLAPVMGASA
jgi:hypothetical protein